MSIDLSDAPAPPASSAGSASTIRPYAAADSVAVAGLLVRAFAGNDGPAPAGMAPYLKEVYLDAPWVDPALSPRVMVAGGSIVGFLGVSALPMIAGPRRIRAAIISSLAVDPRAGDPTIGPRLLRDLRNAPQDAVLADRSNAVATTLLRSLGAEVMRAYSFDWIRTLRPAGLALETLASRFAPARLLKPLTAPLDAVALKKGLSSEDPRWSAPSRSRAAESFADHDAAPGEIDALFKRLLSGVTLRPDWSDADIATILAHAARKADLGAYTARVVTAPNGTAVGFFLYHLKPGRIAHVLQIMAVRGREGVVVDRAIAHATAAGAVAIRGRSTPVLLDALMSRRAIFVPELATVVWSRDQEVLQHFREGNAFFTGLAGENWMRLNGDGF